MEVHKHPHHVTHKKKWTEYLLEFFMLFLAVFLGFIAENMREDVIEKHRERDYIVSASQDLKADIYVMDSIIKVRKLKDKMLDSLLYLLNYSNIKKNGNDIYYYARWAPRTYRFYMHDRTMQQLKNSGNWRLIQKKNVSDALETYDELNRSLNVYIEQREEALVLIMYSSLNKLFNNQVFEKMINGLSFKRPTDNPQLLSEDKMVLNEFCNQIHFLKNSNLYFINTSQTLLNNAMKALDILKKEYNLE